LKFISEFIRFLKMELQIGEVKVKIDPEDWPLVSDYHWFINSSGYPITFDLGTCKLLHRMIMEYHFGNQPLDVDHIDRNKLNNQKSNLRFCSHMVNCRNHKLHIHNKTGYTGIRFTKSRKWEVEVNYNYRKYYVGRFDSIEDALEQQRRTLASLGVAV
jgi:hypothetical protein